MKKKEKFDDNLLLTFAIDKCYSCYENLVLSCILENNVRRSRDQYDSGTKENFKIEERRFFLQENFKAALIF